MTAPPRQLTLDWPHAPSFAREDFLRAPENAAALDAIEAWPRWPSPTMMLTGPTGSGKSHLGAIWARMSGARLLAADALDEVAPPDFADAPALLIEDSDRVGQRETALFHLLNGARERGAAVLVTARLAPDLWGLKTPDLVSRLRLAPVLVLGAPELALTRAVLVKLFEDRQLVVDPAVIAYLARNLERSLDAARAVVAALDREALSRGRRVSRAMAAEWLREAGEREGAGNLERDHD